MQPFRRNKKKIKDSIAFFNSNRRKMNFHNNSKSGKKVNNRYMKDRRNLAKESSLNKSNSSEEGILREAGKELGNRHLLRKVSFDSSAFTNFIQYKGCKGNNKVSFWERTLKCLRSAMIDN
jgi:hypothetical protein